MITPEERNRRLNQLEPQEEFTTFGGALKDFSAGLGLSVVKATEGVFEIGNIVPGVDYDLRLVEEVKNAFNYEESDSFAEQAGETIGFLASLFTGAGAVGKAASLTGKLAKSSKALRGYNRTRAAQATTALIKKHPKTAAFLGEEAKYAMADFLMTSGDDAFDVVSALGLDDTAIVEHFAMEEGESELSRRLKGALQGFAVGVPFEFALKGVGKVADKLKGSPIEQAPIEQAPISLEEQINDVAFEQISRSIKEGMDNLVSKEPDLFAQEELLDNLIEQSGRALRVKSDSLEHVSREALEEMDVESLRELAYKYDDPEEVVGYGKFGLIELIYDGQLADKAALLRRQVEEAVPGSGTKGRGQFVSEKESEEIQRTIFGDEFAAKVDELVTDEARERVKDITLSDRVAIGAVGPEEARQRGFHSLLFSQDDRAVAVRMLSQAQSSVDEQEVGFLLRALNEAGADSERILKNKTINKAFKLLPDDAKTLLDKKPGELTPEQTTYLKAEIDKALMQTLPGLSNALKNSDTWMDTQKAKLKYLSEEDKAIFRRLTAGDLSVTDSQLDDLLDKLDSINLDTAGDIVNKPIDPNIGPTGLGPVDPDAPGGPTMFFDRGQIDEGFTGAGSGDFNVQNMHGAVLEIARALENIGVATGKQGGILDFASTLKNVSPQTQEAATVLGNAIGEQRFALELAIKEGRIKGDDLVEAKNKLLELNRMRDELEAKVPGLFRGKTPVEHIEVVDRIVADLTPTTDAAAINKAAKVLKGEYKGTLTEQDISEAITVLTKDASPADQLSIIELAAYRGKTPYDISDEAFEGTRVEVKEILGEDIEESLHLFAEKTGEAMGSDPKRIYTIYSNFLNELQFSFDDISTREITGIFTKEKQLLLLTQKADLIATLVDAMSGVIRPKELHNKRNLSSLTVKQVEEMSPNAVNRELSRSGASRRYNFDVISGMKATLAGNNYEISTAELLSRMSTGRFAGTTSKAAELNIAMIMAGTKLLGSNLIQNYLKGWTDRWAKAIGRKIFGKTKPRVVNPVTLQKTRSSISLWSQFTKASYKGQRRSGTGSLLSGVDASREVRPQVSAFKDQNAARDIGFIAASAADDGTKAMVLLTDTLDALSTRTDLTSEQFEIIQANLPDIIAKRLEIGGHINQKDLAADLVDTIKVTELDTPKVKRDYATMESEVETIFNNAFQSAKDRTFTEFRSKESIQEEHGTALAAVSQVTRGIAEFTETIPGVGPLVRNVTMAFVNTPINAMLYGSSFTPLSKSWRRAFIGQIEKLGVKIESPTVKKLFGEFDPNNPEHIRAMGKFWIGNTIMGTTLALHTSGLIEVTGRGPDEPAARKEWLKAGNQPYSITLGSTGKVIGLRRLGPMAAPFMVAAELKELFAENPWSEEALSDDIAGAMAALGESVMGMSSLDSSAKLLDAIVNQDESAINQIVANLAVPVVGAPVTAVANALPILSSAGAAASQFFQREDRIPGQTMVDSIKSSIQNRYLRFTADTRRNAYGEALDVNKYDALTASILPVLEVTTKEMDRVDKELASLNYPVSKVKHIMSGLNLTEAKYAIGNQSAYDRYQELLGTTRVGGRTLTQELDKLIRSSKYRKLPTEGVEELNLESPKVLEIRKTFATYRAAAKEELMKENALLKGDLRRVEAAKLSLQTGRSPETIISQLFEI